MAFNGTQSQIKYWKALIEVKNQDNYLNEYLKRDEKINNWLNGILAVSSSSSIGGWIIWDTYSFIWGAIIAVSHVINALKHIFPYKKRIKMLTEVTPQLEKLFIDSEEKWYQISEGLLEDKQIHENYINLKKKKHKIFGKLTNIPDNKKCIKLAEEATLLYFKNFYQREEKK